MAKYVDVVIVGAQLEVRVLRTVSLVEDFFHGVFMSIQFEPDRALIRLCTGITLDLHVHLYAIVNSTCINPAGSLAFNNTCLNIQHGILETYVEPAQLRQLAVLLDGAKPVWTEVKSPATSRISDEEMARINIEASAALAEWVDLCRSDKDRRLYFKLVDRAVCYLPMTKRKSKLRFSEFMALANPEIATKLIEVCNGVYLERTRADAERTPGRLFANALTNHLWRNGPVENIHAGSFRGYPLDQRRMSLQEERELMSFASERLALGMQDCRQLAAEEPRRHWSEQVVPYGLAGMLLITPSRWSLTKSSRMVRLRAAN